MNEALAVKNSRAKTPLKALSYLLSIFIITQDAYNNSAVSDRFGVNFLFYFAIGFAQELN